MKIAVYTIALNEAGFVKRWYESARQADLLIIGDTGSTDGTAELAESLGIKVVNIAVSPWRFDMARNALLTQIPLDVDYCVALDMDEILIDGWRDQLEALPDGVTRPRYKYTWSWRPDGSAGLQYGGDKIHSRRGYRWKHPVHEVLTPYWLDEVQHWTELEIHHHPDPTKSRSMYLPMLEIAVAEDPHDDRNRFYLGRELVYAGRLQDAHKHLCEYLKLSEWQAERAWAMRLLAMCEPESEWFWLDMSDKEWPSRESATALAFYYYKQNEWDECLYQANRALEITEKPLEYLTDPDVWSWLPWDLAAVAAFNLKMYNYAVNLGAEAVRQAPDDQRLADNLVHYRRHADQTSQEMS